MPYIFKQFFRSDPWEKWIRHLSSNQRVVSSNITWSNIFIILQLSRAKRPSCSTEPIQKKSTMTYTVYPVYIEKEQYIYSYWQTSRYFLNTAVMYITTHHIFREKGRDLIQSYNKSPMQPQKNPKSCLVNIVLQVKRVSFSTVLIITWIQLVGQKSDIDRYINTKNYTWFYKHDWSVKIKYVITVIWLVIHHCFANNTLYKFNVLK